MARERIREALERHPFTAGFGQEHLDAMAVLAREVTFDEDQIIFRLGERSECFYLVLEGSLRVEISTPVYAVCIQALEPGDTFGWSALLPGHQTTFQVRARERCQCICLDGTGLATACKNNPQFGYEFFRRLLHVVAGRVSAAESSLAALFGLPVHSETI